VASKSRCNKGETGEGGPIPGDEPRPSENAEAIERGGGAEASDFSFQPRRNLKEIRLGLIAKKTWKGMIDDRVYGHAAELGFYFLFSLFPTLLCASSILGLAARSAYQIYDRLLGYLALVIPTSAMSTVLQTFNETTAHATPGKITFGLIAAIWSASAGISAVQDTLNAVYNIADSRSYIVARIQAIGLTILLIALVSAGLASLMVGSYLSTLAAKEIHEHILRFATEGVVHTMSWVFASLLLMLTFAVLYYWAPDSKKRHWRWLTPGGAIGIAGWLVASLGFRVYLHFFNTYSFTYGSLGAVIILLMWFYITGLMFLLGAEINCQIGAASAA
jgi:membrane protein